MNSGVGWEQDGRLLGAAWARHVEPVLIRDEATGEPLREIVVGVVETARGAGIGRKLLEELQARAEVTGCPGLALTVSEQNPAAVRLYERVGFLKYHRTASGLLLMNWRPLTPPRMHVRAGRVGDEKAIAEVHVRSWQAAYRGQVPDEFLDELSIARRTHVWRRILADSAPPANQEFVLEKAQRLVGFVHVAPSSDIDVGKRVGELTAIYVLPDSWRVGGGRMLMERAIASLSSAGLLEATLWVLEENERARRFYEAFGWAPDGATKNELRKGFVLHEVRYRLTAPEAAHSPG